MAALDSSRLREIAQIEVAQILPGIAPGPLDEYVTAIVRQWVTYHRRAGLFTSYVNYWLDLVDGGGVLVVGLGPYVNDFPKAIDSWGGRRRDLPALAHQLTLAQHATFTDAAGKRVRVTADPTRRTVRFDEVREHEEPGE
jgi:hypothetical protein